MPMCRFKPAGYYRWWNRKFRNWYGHRQHEYARLYLQRLVRAGVRLTCAEMRHRLMPLCERISKRPNRTCTAAMQFYRCPVLLCAHCTSPADIERSEQQSQEAVGGAIKARRSFSWLLDEDLKAHRWNHGLCHLCGVMFCHDRLCRKLNWMNGEAGLLTHKERVHANNNVHPRMRREFYLACAIRKATTTRSEKLLPFFKRFEASNGQRHEANQQRPA